MCLHTVANEQGAQQHHDQHAWKVGPFYRSLTPLHHDTKLKPAMPTPAAVGHMARGALGQISLTRWWVHVALRGAAVLRTQPSRIEALDRLSAHLEALDFKTPPPPLGAMHLPATRQA